MTVGWNTHRKQEVQYGGAALRNFRNGHHMTQVQFGSIAGLNQNQVAQIETGRREIKEHEGVRWAEHFKFSAKDFNKLVGYEVIDPKRLMLHQRVSNEENMEALSEIADDYNEKERKRQEADAKLEKLKQMQRELGTTPSAPETKSVSPTPEAPTLLPTFDLNQFIIAYSTAQNELQLLEQYLRQHDAYDEKISPIRNAVVIIKRLKTELGELNQDQRALNTLETLNSIIVQEIQELKNKSK